jgi:8-oxo-dGTP diphosphatase
MRHKTLPAIVAAAVEPAAPALGAKIIVADARSYPDRPFLAVSAAIVRDGKILLVRRARPPAQGLFSLPGGVVEVGETLTQALIREVREETSLAIEPVGLAGFRETITRDPDGRVERHFVILPFAARWLAGEVALNEELSEARWLHAADLAGLPTTPGLDEIVANALQRLQEAE